ncbi:hypothetical protein FB45DRAFT_998966 [Roridomyces roridus]|uniref:Uncharacterized protein n=1 Tax=Roridomyces roridus TaxID=1738132 RepID=A0AAD7FU73_9AGAR|nr:hypothetical protein FB45DRAFT_998966 [Roridomyces roridus]
MMDDEISSPDQVAPRSKFNRSKNDIIFGSGSSQISSPTEIITGHQYKLLWSQRKAEKYIPPPQTTAAEIDRSTAREDGAGADKSGINSGNNNGEVKHNEDRKKLRERHKSGIECLQNALASSNPAPNLETVSSLPRTEAEAHSAVKDEAAQGGYNPMVMMAKAVRRGFESASNLARSSGVVNGEGQEEVGHGCGREVEEATRSSTASAAPTRLGPGLVKVGTVELEPTGDRPRNRGCVLCHICRAGAFSLSQDLSARNGRRGYVSPIQSGPYARTPTTRIISPLSACAQTPAVIDTLQPLPRFIWGSAPSLLRCC